MDKEQYIIERTEQNLVVFSGLVNRRIEEGYVPIGGLVRVREFGRSMYCQAMFLKESK